MIIRVIKLCRVQALQVYNEYYGELVSRVGRVIGLIRIIRVY